jgi:hypothetical protein
MELNATVVYRGALAYFKIKRESPGIYLAELVYYNRHKGQSPPRKITLARGIRQWTGSHEDPSLLEQIGKKIEEALSSTQLNKSDFM